MEKTLMLGKIEGRRSWVAPQAWLNFIELEKAVVLV